MASIKAKTGIATSDRMSGTGAPPNLCLTSLRVVRTSRLALVIAFILCTGYSATAQMVHIGVTTLNAAGSGQARVKVLVGPHVVTTGEAGIGSVDVRGGTYALKAETECRVVSFTTTINRYSERTGGTPTEPVMTFTAPHDLPIGIEIRLDCAAAKPPKKTTGPAKRKK